MNTINNEPLNSAENAVEKSTEEKKPNWKEVGIGYLMLFSIVTVVVGLDQWTKTLVRENIPFGQTWDLYPNLAPYARIVHWKNSGAAFGMFQEGGSFFKILAIIVAIMIIYYFPQIPKEEWALRVALSFQMAGALGNLADRLQFGEVTDFISVGNFAVFNIADASISVGVVILLIGIGIMEYHERKLAKKNSIEVVASENNQSGEM